jgi:hypothetical protein
MVRNAPLMSNLAEPRRASERIPERRPDSRRSVTHSPHATSAESVLSVPSVLSVLSHQNHQPVISDTVKQEQHELALKPVRTRAVTVHLTEDEFRTLRRLHRHLGPSTLLRLQVADWLESLRKQMEKGRNAKR